MKKFKKIIVGSVLTMVITLISVTGVSAAQSGGYSTTVKKNGGLTYVTPETTASTNYYWGLNYIYSLSGGNIISRYYRYHNNTFYNQIGADIKHYSGTTNKGAVWSSQYKGLYNLPAYFGTGATAKICSGTGTDSTYCALSGRSYQMVLYNDSSVDSTIQAQFTLTEH